MPTSVADAFAAVGLVREGVVKWGTPPPSSASGVYIVSLTKSLDDAEGALNEFPAAAAPFDKWLAVRQELTFDGFRPNARELADRVGRFWIPDEVILYVGSAKCLGSRVGDYYKTPIGARSPHSGGYFLKLLAGLDRLWVHYSPGVDFMEAEDGILRRFMECVSDGSRKRLLDPAHPFPFANLEWPKGSKKLHGLRGVREPRVVDSDRSRRQGLSNGRIEYEDDVVGTRSGRTQRVTAADLHAGQIRIPSQSSATTKALFPAVRIRIALVLRGQALSLSWNPRIGLNRERSGVLKVGPKLCELVRADEVLTVSVDDEGVVAIN